VALTTVKHCACSTADNAWDGNYQCKIHTVPKLRALTKLFKMYARSEALIMVIMKIPVLEHAL
jgi:hypothetical protein